MLSKRELYSSSLFLNAPSAFLRSRISRSSSALEAVTVFKFAVPSNVLMTYLHHRLKAICFQTQKAKPKRKAVKFRSESNPEGSNIQKLLNLTTLKYTCQQSSEKNWLHL